VSDRDRRGQIERMFYRIGEAAHIVGEEPHVLRYWEKEFRFVRPQKSASGQRVYSRKDIEKLLRIKSLLKDHRYTIEGAKKRLREVGVEPREAADPVVQSAGKMRDALLSVRSELADYLAKLEPEA
jgi:DNA-binding transcriptional MerR regulator